MRNPDGIAVDWVARNLYWCDKTTDTIEVSKLHGAYRKVLVRQGLQEPRGLEVFPAKGLLYFTDWGDQPNIGRIWMDGTHRQTIIKDNLAWPNALTIDYMTEHIFWADASLDYIAMAKLDGSGRRIVVSNIHYVPHVFGLSVFEDHIYWSDWEKMGIYYTNKFSGNKITKLVLLVHRPMDLQVLHPYRQLPSKCAVNTHKPGCAVNTHKPRCAVNTHKPGCAVNTHKPRCAVNTHKPGCAVNTHKPRCAVNTHKPGCAVNTHKPGCAVNTHKPRCAVNTHKPRCAVNTHKPGCAVNTHKPRCAVNTHKPRCAVNTHTPRCAVNTQT